MFSSIEEVIERFAAQKYIANRRIATVVFLASRLQKPILVEGPAGVGKNDLAKVLAAPLGHELIRLQCYEGLEEAKALYEWEYAKQLLYTQILKDKISEVLSNSRGLAGAVDRIAREDEVFFSERFILPRPLLRAITSAEPVVLLVDEIDKADAEFEAFLLELLSDFQVSVPEIGTLKARTMPLVVLTSNNAREMSDALKRRCLHLYIDLPDRAQELAILKLKAPEASEKLAEEVVTGRAIAAQDRSQEDPRHQRDHRLGQGADAAQSRYARRCAGQRHPRHHRQVRGRRAQGTGGAQELRAARERPPSGRLGQRQGPA
jgi:MoxR-like ATPase